MKIPGGERIIEALTLLKALNHHGIRGTRRLSDWRPPRGHVHPDWKGHDIWEKTTPLKDAMRDANDNV